MQDARPGTLLLDRDGAIWLRGSNRARCLAGAEEMVTGDGRWSGGAYVDATERYGPFTVLYPQPPEGVAASLRAAEAEVAALRGKLDAVGRVLSESGCGCECGCYVDEHDDDCDRCLACRVQVAINVGGRA